MGILIQRTKIILLCEMDGLKIVTNEKREALGGVLTIIC
jgi:hypothetical protein